MHAYLVFSLQHTIYLLKKEKNFFYKKNSIFVTDKLIIYNLLKSKNIKTECLEKYIQGRKRKNLFIKYYKNFDKKLKKTGEKNKVFINNKKINSIYNTYRGNSPRYYVGAKFLFIALTAISKKYKIKDIVYLNDLEPVLPLFLNTSLDQEFYVNIFKLFCKKNNIKFKRIKTFNFTNESLNEKLIKYFFNIYYIINEINFSKIFYFIKKIFSKINFIKSKNSILILDPASDIYYSKYSTRKVFFKNFVKKFSKILFKFKSNKNIELIPEKSKNISDILLDAIKRDNLFLKNFFEESFHKLFKFIKDYKVKEIFWGTSPSPIIRNSIMMFKNKVEISGVQHGGKYFLMDEDICHRDSDYAFCDKFYAYGISKKFNKKKYSKSTKLINSGSLKDDYNLSNIDKISDKDSLSILYIPISLSTFNIPAIETSPIERFYLQRKICEAINNTKNVSKFIKIIPKTFYKDHNFDFHSLETNPIYYELKKYHSIKIVSDSILKTVKKLNPSIIITDYLSTPVFELANSKSNIIVFLDKNNYPKKDVLISLKKRVHIVNSVKEMNSYIKKILKNKISKNLNQEFYNLFYKSKINQFKVFQNV